MRAIRRFKYASRMSFRRTLEDLAVSTYVSRLADIRLDLVVPVPCHPRTLRRRGVSLPALLAQAIHRREGLPWAPEALKKSLDIPDLVGLNAEQRTRAVKRAYHARQSIHGNVLLVDDVVTTTATARACAAACRDAGADQIWVLALARTPEKLHGQRVL